MICLYSYPNITLDDPVMREIFDHCFILKVVCSNEHMVINIRPSIYIYVTYSSPRPLSLLLNLCAGKFWHGCVCSERTAANSSTFHSTGDKILQLQLCKICPARSAPPNKARVQSYFFSIKQSKAAPGGSY
jgi:hypothetical protein